MQTVPQKIKDIRNTAINSVFADDINELDEQSKEVLEKILNYMEKKYISIPMVMAKDILVKE
jgi:glutamyl-tRNA reductase